MVQFIQQRIFEDIKRAYDDKSLAHGMLFYVPQRIDLEPLLKKIVAMILQKSSFDDLSQNPDVHFVKDDNDQIKSNVVSSVMDELKLTSYNMAKIVVIIPVEALNISATSILLKTLEEPAENTYFFLVSYQLKWVIPTILSRVQVINVMIPESEKITYLKNRYNMSPEAIKKAFNMTRGDIYTVDRIRGGRDFWLVRKYLISAILSKHDVVKTAEKLSLTYLDAIYWLTSLVIDAYYISLGVNTSFIANFDRKDFVLFWSQKHESIKLHSIYKDLLLLKDLHGKHFSLNKRLALESILLQL